MDYVFSDVIKVSRELSFLEGEIFALFEQPFPISF